MHERFRLRLDQALQDKVFPGYAFASIDKGQVEMCTGGHFTYDLKSPVVQVDTLYDVASITKIVGPMMLAMMLVDEGVLHFDDKIGDYLPSYRDDEYKRDATLRHALTYTLDYNIPGGSKSLMGSLSPEQVAADTLACPPRYAPGTNYTYSNITAFIVTQIIEKATGRNFYELVQEWIFGPLQMRAATFAPSANLLSQIPPTEVTADRGEVRGVVHDEFSAHLMSGGISCGAAGLFASSYDLANFLQMILQGGVYQGQRLVSEALVQEWTRNQFPHLLPTRTPLGWGDLNNELIASSSHQIVIKGGFTGCLVVADLTTKQGFVWLSNRTYPVRPEDMTSLRELKKDLVGMLRGE
jgi:CubicO group peptidase (beta-lactamase class C family)